MNLDFIDRLTNKLEQNQGVQRFINELGNFLKNTIEERDNNMGVLDKIEKERNVSLVSKNKIRNQKQEILKHYAEETQNEGDLYFVTKKRNEEGIYRVEKYNENSMEVIDMQLPKYTLSDSVMREKKGKYVLDEKATSYVAEEIENMAGKILEEQMEELKDYRREGHLYLVTGDTNGRIYLSDQTEKRGYEIEEVDFTEELKSEVAEGTILKYEDGSYHILEE